MNEFAIGAQPVATGFYASECSVEMCRKSSSRKGFCVMHYKRFLRHGSATAGRAENGKRRQFIEEIATKYEGNDCLIWPFPRSKNGYANQRWNGRQSYAHRIVCELVHGDPPTSRHEAAHSCGRGEYGCVNPKHLRWATPSENSLDKLSHGTDRRGEKTPNSKLTNADAYQIKKRLKRGEMHQDIAEDYGVSRATVTAISMGVNWGWMA